MAQYSRRGRTNATTKRYPPNSWWPVTHFRTPSARTGLALCGRTVPPTWVLWDLDWVVCPDCWAAIEAEGEASAPWAAASSTTIPNENERPGQWDPVAPGSYGASPPRSTTVGTVAGKDGAPW